MRLIDADKLNRKKKYLIQTQGGCFPKSEWFIKADDLFAAPTVNPYKWISVKDRLPEERTEVLVYRGSHIGDMMNVHTYLGHGSWEDSYGYWSRTEDEGITYWMYLPDPPKEE